jgi:dienelactone hydrolase
MSSLRQRIAEFIGFEPVAVAPRVHVEQRDEEADYTRSLLRYSVPDGDTITAILFEPRAGGSPGGVLALHQHNSQWAIGKSEIAGLVGDPLQAFGPALARRGVTVLAPDAIGFESRAGAGHGDTPVAPSLTRPGSTPDGWLQFYNQMAHRLVRGDLLMRKMLSDASAAIPVLRSVCRPGAPIGVLGHSMGGNVALFLGALDTRIGFTGLSGAACSYRHKLAHGIGLDMTLVIPSLASHFDIADVLACIAPRHALVVSGHDDWASADAADVVRDARRTFDAAHASERLTHLRLPGGHALDQRRFDHMVEWLVSQAG